MFKYFFKFMLFTFIVICLVSVFSTYIIKQNKEEFEAGSSTSVPRLSDILDEIDKSVIDTDEDFITQSVEVENMTKKFISTLGTYRKKVISYLKKNKNKFVDVDEEEYTTIITKKSKTNKKQFTNEEDEFNEENELNEETELSEEHESNDESTSRDDDTEDQIEGFICDSVASYEEYR